MKGETSPSDFETEILPLWQRAQSGDEVAYRESLDLIARRLRFYFRRRMPTLQDDVEDLVQDTLLAVHLQRGTYDPTFAVSAWFTAIARHKLVDLWRRRGRGCG
jgi:RNA polymerase sigma-70 factor (ECF subfamily)